MENVNRRHKAMINIFNKKLLSELSEYLHIKSAHKKERKKINRLPEENTNHIAKIIAIVIKINLFFITGKQYICQR